MRNNLQDIKPMLKALSLYQLIGGVIGIGFTIYLIANTNPLPALLLLIMLFAIGLYVYSIYCGVILLKNASIGLKLSKINQILQVFHFTLFGYSFKYISGVHFSPGIDLTESLKFQLNFSFSAWQVNINSGEPDAIISLNLVALFLIAFIDKVLHRLKTAKIEETIRQLGQQEKEKQLIE
jgi:hypothetical protein